MRRTALFAAALGLCARSALACPACAIGTTSWFRWTTLILSIVPVAAIGAVIWWIRRQVVSAAAGGVQS
jgi:hypothetical protein